MHKLLMLCLMAVGVLLAENTAPPAPTPTPDPFQQPAAGASSAAQATAPPTVSPTSPAIPLADVFSIEKNTGVGELVFSRAGRVESAQLGTAGGMYAMGLVFTAKTLPEHFQWNVGEGEVIQIVIGRLPQQGKMQVSQFATGMVVLERPLSQTKLVSFSMLDAKSKPPSNVAVLLFSPPSSLTESSEEDKLKNTFFAQSGNVILTPKGKSKTLTVNQQGTKLKFDVRSVLLEVDAKLGTPFNAEDAFLKGNVEVPFYAPAGATAESFLREIANDSLGSVSPVVPQPKPTRGVSSRK